MENIKLKTITYKDSIYTLREEVDCSISIGKTFTVISNENLGISGYGIDEIEALKDFSMEFDFIHQRYNELSNDQLTDDVIKIKEYLNRIIIKNE